jgi:hypothetical protein
LVCPRIDKLHCFDIKYYTYKLYDCHKTIFHVVTKCPIRVFKGTPNDIHIANGNIVELI